MLPLKWSRISNHFGTVFRHGNRYRFSAPKSVPFSDTEIGVARRYRNQCRVTGRLVLKLAHKSVSFYGTLGAEIESESVSPGDTEIGVVLRDV